MQVQQVIDLLHMLADHKVLKRQERFKIATHAALGITIPQLRTLARQIGKNHELALGLWKSGIREAMILASMIDVSAQVTQAQMEDWVKDFDSWDICDQTCGNLFRYTSFVSKKCLEWSSRKNEFIKRAGFALMATCAVGDKSISDEQFIKFLPVIIREATDDRNFVKKAVNWALRQIGKRNKQLHAVALETAHQVAKLDSKSARWIANDAIRELSSDAVIMRLSRKK